MSSISFYRPLKKVTSQASVADITSAAKAAIDSVALALRLEAALFQNVYVDRLFRQTV